MILVLGLAAGVMLIGQEQVFRLGASADSVPQDVRISNITDTSFTVSWTTAKDVIGYVSWGQSSSLGQLARPVDTSTKRVHFVTVKDLTPSTNHFFVINSGGSEHDNNGVPWAVQTGPTLSASTSTTLASGRVLNANNTPASNVLVYLNGGAFSQLSTTTSPNGTWTIPLSTARTKTLTSYSTLTQDSVVEVFVQGVGSVSTSQALISQMNPLPDMILGQTYDFRNSTINASTGLPEANVNLPESEDTESIGGPGGLDVSGEAETEAFSSVTINSIDEPNEVIFTTLPEFFGDGPPGTELVITVESDPITEEVNVSSSGTWRWSPPEDLDEGEHKITVKWFDSQGVLRSLTRTFVVQAAEGEPSFVSTPSGSTATPSPTSSPKPSPTPTKSPTPSPTAVVTATPSATPTPTLSPTATPTRASIPSTESGMPVAGSLTPTLLLGSIGLLLFISGIVISKRSNL